MFYWLKIRWVYHVLFWVISLSILLLNMFLGSEGSSFDSAEFLTTSLIISGLIIITYVHIFLIDQFFKKRKYLIYIAGIITLALSFVVIIEIQNDYGVEIIDPPLKNFMAVLFICAAGAGVRYFKKGIINQYQLQELKAKNAEIELSMLKTQLNPHFLFNTLNNICGINQIDADKGTEMLMELADLLRYHLSHSKVEQISLREEIELINSYVALVRLRLTESTKVIIAYPNQIDGINITPLLFLPFIENAFKHGTHPQKPSFVKIKMDASKDMVSLLVENSKHNNLKTISTNIGLENTKRRLHLTFPNRHKLVFQDEPNTFRVSLSLKL